MEKQGKKVKNEIEKERIDKYRKLTGDALKKTKDSVFGGKEKEAKEIFDMVENYLSDSLYFEENGNFIDAFAALNYAHGWIDAGVRLDVFDVDDDRLFTVK